MAPLDECWSPGQSSQNAAEVFAEKVPASHGRHSDWPVPPCALPGEHPVQPVADVFAANFPALQARQLSLPRVSWYLPTSHALHSSAPAPLDLPASQSAHPLKPPSLACFPAWHGEQKIAPSIDEWRPGRQSMHSDWPVPPCVLPGEHSVQLVADAFGANLPELHGKQDILPPSAMKYPGVQSMHSDWPDPPCAFPMAHSVQVVVNP